MAPWSGWSVSSLGWGFAALEGVGVAISGHAGVLKLSGGGGAYDHSEHKSDLSSLPTSMLTLEWEQP